MKNQINTRHGGHASSMRARQIVANPEGSREERRAAKKIKSSQGKVNKKSGRINHGRD